MTLIAANTLTDSELDLLDDFLYSDQVAEDCLDIIGVHGLFCALKYQPNRLYRKRPGWNWSSTVHLSGNLTRRKLKLLDCLQRYYQSIGANLYSDGEIELPCELSLDAEEDEDISPLAWWAQAFMEAVFTQEEEWFGGAEETVAEMLLPVMVASDLFDEDDINKIRDDERLCAEMCSQIPELLIDLYLHFHAPEK